MVAVYQQELDKLSAEDQSPERTALVGELHWMLEEYRVSVFAQELGTAHAISPKRLDKKLEQIRQLP